VDGAASYHISRACQTGSGPRDEDRALLKGRSGGLSAWGDWRLSQHVSTEFLCAFYSFRAAKFTVMKPRSSLITK
jgi:hypothetical protein